MVTRQRNEIIFPTDTVRLTITFRNGAGTPIDPDAFPTLTIVQPSGGVVLGPTSAGVYRSGVGMYGFDYTVGFTALGVWHDIWQGSISSMPIIVENSFVILLTQVPALNVDGYHHLGDDPGFNYSQTAICNINQLLKLLRARLNSRGLHADVDSFGNRVYTDCDIFTTDQLVSFLVMSLSEFNEIPHFTFFTFDDTPAIEQFLAVLTQGAALMALSSQALIERGREFQISDNGIGFTPPTMSELLNTEWATELANWYEKVKFIKNNLKPSPLGLGTLRPLAAAPQFARLRFLRARQLF